MLINSCGCSFKAYFAESLSSATASKKKKKSWVEAAIHVCAVEIPEDGTSQEFGFSKSEPEEYCGGRLDR